MKNPFEKIISKTRQFYYSLPLESRMVLSWMAHGGVVVLAYIVFGRYGALLAGGFYIGQEVTQHRFEGTFGKWAWIDRVADGVVPLALGLVLQ